MDRTDWFGWPGDPEGDVVTGLRRIVIDLGKRLVVTFGSRGVLVVDGAAGNDDRFIPVTPVEVAGTTVACGGALPTAWVRPLADEAYGRLLGPT